LIGEEKNVNVVINKGNNKKGNDNKEGNNYKKGNNRNIDGKGTDRLMADGDIHKDVNTIRYLHGGDKRL
jgi:hypothetical protein